jgi:phage tail-like protein
MPLLSGYALIAGYANLPQVRLDPYMPYNFFVELGGLIVGGFTEVSGLSSEVKLEPYQEGGVNGYVHHFLNQVEYPPLVLSRGLTDLDVLWDWYWLTAIGKPLLLNGTIMLLDSQRLPVMWWNFKDAYPVKWEGPQFNANSTDQIGIERIELVHRGLVKPASSQALSATRAGAAIARQAGANTGMPF